ncbi:MAG: T9SS type A sorting domain-containing protein [Prolixibacteraceae bacterium]|nr:T9SS type A sorting domain-containing protein [Prolixibacteraceae bacterium]
MKKSIHKNSQLPFPGIQEEFRISRWSFNRIKTKMIRNLALALLIWLPLAANAALTLPAIPSNASLSKKFELSTEMAFRVKVGETFLPSGALIAYINGEIRGAQTASVIFPATGVNVYKILVFNDKTGDEISFKYYDIFSEKIYDITEKIEFVPNLVPDYANPEILTAFCKPITVVTGLLPENGKENVNATLDLFWQPSPNTTYYNLFVWEDGAAMPATPTYTNIYSTTRRLYNLKYGQLYRWKVGSVNDCSSIESSEQSFRIRQLPDLTINGEIQAPASVESGSNFTVNFSIKNIGVGNTAGTTWNDFVYVSNDATFSNDDLLLSNTTNLRQLDPDSIYTRSVTVSLPLDYSGNYYFFVRTDRNNSVAELLEDNNQALTSTATAVTAKTLPDILVKDIQPTTTDVNPGDSLTISWKVENRGGITATGGWSERITIVPLSGLKIVLSPNTEYRLPLPSGSTIDRSRRIKIPEIAKFSGEASIEVELFPFPELQEYAADKANNKAQSAGNISLADNLTLVIQSASLLESTPLPVRCIVTRSGDIASALDVNLSASVAGQVTIPASVTIPANQSSIVFNLNTVNNAALEGPRNVDITAGAASYANSVKTITILDDEIPKLTGVLSNPTPTEGETIELTVTRDLVTDQALNVSIATNKANQWTFPSSLVIPANEASGKVSVVITDDNLPELKSDAYIFVSSAGVTPGQVVASFIDNDVPQVTFEILSDTVSESGGVYATWGVITRVKGDENITVNLTQSPAGALFFPATITLVKGVGSQKFNIGVVDNGDVDGYRKSLVTGSIYLSSCNCGTTPDNGGVVTAELVIADNDGPALSVSVNPLSLPEGKTNAGNLTISRNTPTDDALEVTISHNDDTEVSIQTSATIPAGQKSVIVPINTINDDVEDGNQMVMISASAPTFTTGFGYIFVTDQNKPDLEITDIALDKTTAATNEMIEISGAAFNSGFATAPSGVKVNFYSSKDNKLDDKDQLLSEFTFPSPIPKETSANFVHTVEVPDVTGNFFILGKINPNEQITELAYFNNESEPVSLAILPEYTATVQADEVLYLPNTTIPIHGIAKNKLDVPMPNVDVDVYLITNGLRRVIKVKTNASGEFTADFVPNPNESGHYIIGACYPEQNLDTQQDAFDIPGMMRTTTGHIIWEMKLGQTLTGKIAIKNTSEATLNKVVIVADKLPAGCDLKFDTIVSLAGNQTKEFSFTLKSTELTIGKDYEQINFTVSSLEGATTSFPAYYYCQALQAQLKIDPVSLNTTMTKGKTRIYELYLYNNGAGESGTVTISLPNVDWMTLLSPATIPNLSAQDTAKVILSLTPTADTPLNTPISGNIAVNSANGSGFQLPYRIEAVSEETGTLKIDVIDEYTYYTEAKPHVKNAHVVVRHPFSGKIMADGFTDENGIFQVENLPEGAYKMNVEADKHEGFQTTVIIDPGRVNEQTVFLSFQAITYTWEVVPTEIEDSYEVQLVMKFETNVPVPVVVMEMPTEMPQLFNDETFPFMITLTNKGLITANDVQVNLPQNDPEYVFLTNFTKLDLLAQQAIQVPVVMKRRDALKSASIANGLESTQETGPCTDYAFTIYGWECGKDGKWGSSSHGITFSGRICAGTGSGGGYGGWGGWGGGGGPGRGGGNSGYYTPSSSAPSFSLPEIGCDKCLIDIAQAILGCVKLHPYAALASSVAGCAYSAMDGEITFMDAFNCVIGFTPAKYARDGYKCALGIANAAKTCYEDPPFFLKSGHIARATNVSKMPPILLQSVHDLEAFLYGNNAANSIISEFMSTVDWDSKENFNDFVDQIKPFTSTLKSILPADLLLIQQNMAGTDISNDEISIFATRWNNTLEAHANNVETPTAQYPNIVDYNVLQKYIQRIDSVKNYTLSRGFTDVGDMYVQSMETIEDQVFTGSNSVCSSVTINIAQKVVMTREAFKGTLTIFNGHGSEPMKEVKLNLEIKDENGVLSNDLFHIETSALDILTGIDGTGTLNAQEKGSATVLFIPEKGAAPEVPKSYSFGGSFSYLDPFTGVTVTKPLFPVTLDVNPSPDLFLHYFMQRDILGDDPLTIPVEPIVPAELAVMIQNNGFGTAKNVRIESAQPKIVENEKGLAINFALIGSNLNGQPRQLGLTNIDFGNIAPKTSTIGQWWFTSDLLGHFISYETKLTHLDSRGNPELSLISGATLHELIKSVRVYSGVEDGINDFLVNEVQDSKETPDIIYLSNGGTLDVYPAVSSSTSGSLASGIELIVTPKQIGWNYHKLSDPGNGAYKIVSVTREDGQVIPLDNVWQTHVTLPDGKEPVYENMIHFLDVFADNASQKYTILFNAPAQNPPAIVLFENVPTSLVTDPVTSINVVFNKPVDATTFNYEDMTLRVQGGDDIMDATVLVTEINQTTFKVDLTTKSTLDGYYALNVQTTGIKDLIGTSGVEGKQANWTQFIGIPAVSEFIGLPENNVGAPFDLLLLRFNVPIDKTTLLPARFTWTKNGTAVSGTIVITEMDTEGKLFQLSGLQEFMTADGKYSLAVDLANIKSLDGNYGILAQSVDWEIDQTAPLVNLITPSTDGGYDSQHRTGFTVQFNEPVKGFGVSSLELWKDGQRQPLSQLEFRKNTDSEYEFTQFRLLTYHEGNYQLKVKMKDITDFAGNSRTDTVKYDWIVYRTKPKAVTDLRITPDMGFSDADAITASQNLFAHMTVNEPNTRIQLYQTDQVNPILLADTANVNTGSLSLPINLIYPGNVKLQAHCIDIFTNTTITELAVFIDEAALVSTWKNAPVTPLTAQPASLQFEFSDKLLDDSQLKDFLKFERDGQSLGTQNLTVLKSAEKIYDLSGMEQVGNATGNYSITLDLTKLNKYLSGKQGVSSSKAQWSIQGINMAPNAFAGTNQIVDENTLVTLDGSGSTDPDSDALTYLWTAPSGITLSSTTVGKPTFTAPEVAADQTLIFGLIVNDGKVNSAVSEVTVTVKNVSGLNTQSIELTTGWNIFSPNVIPANPDMLAIFQNLIDAGKLKKVMDESGKALEDFGAFGGWNNGIGNMEISRGYKVNVKEPVMLNLQGTLATLPMDINLTAGWNIISYPATTPQDAMAIFQALIDAGKLKKVMDESGFALENYGVFGGWTNNIGNLVPNKGYKVNVLSDATLTIPESGNKQAVIPDEILASSHFRKVYTGNGTDHMNINLVDLSKGGFRTGDEIGIFDGNICVGAAQIGSDQMLSEHISIPASCNDGLEAEPNGFISGNTITIRLFRNNQEYLLTPELLFNSKGVFIKDESMFASANTELATSIIDITEPVSVKCYPNPFSDQLTIEIDILTIQELDVKIFDAGGRLIRTLYRGDGIAKKIVFWDGKNDSGMKMASGNYYLKVNNTVKKVIFKH